MKIWVLRINQVMEPQGVITSSYRSLREEKRVEYYASVESAMKRRDEIYSGVKSLTGFIDGLEVVIAEVEVKP
jgi:RecA/RadA recombinase